MKSLQTEKLALFGYPLTYSLSPQIHRLFARQFGLQITYQLHPVSQADLPIKLAAFIAAGGKGINVTAPYKQLICQHLNTLHAEANIVGAVNTIRVNQNGTLDGYNTDGAGLMDDLQTHGIDLSNKKILILGAGGAVRGILPQLLAAQPQAILIYNRTLKNGFDLAAILNSGKISIISAEELNNINADLIIHAISSKPSLEILQKLNFKDAICYDLNYASEGSIFLASASHKGAKLCLNGLGMLVAQAARAFRIWYGLTPSIQPILAYLQHK